MGKNKVRCNRCGLVLEEEHLVQDYPLFKFYRCPRCKKTVNIEKHPERNPLGGDRCDSSLARSSLPLSWV